MHSFKHERPIYTKLYRDDDDDEKFKFSNKNKLNLLKLQKLDQESKAIINSKIRSLREFANKWLEGSQLFWVPKKKS